MQHGITQIPPRRIKFLAMNLRKEKIQSLGLAVLISSNSIASVLSFNGAWILVMVICLFIFMLSRKLSFQKALLPIVILVCYCFLSGNALSSQTNSPSAYNYGLFCLSFGLALYTGRNKVDIKQFFKYMVIIGVVCSPFLLIKARTLAALVFTLEANSGTMMGMTYAIVPTILSAFSLLMIGVGIKWKAICFYLVIVLSVILLLIGSRGAFVVFLVFFLLVFGTIIIKRALYKTLFILVVGIIATFFIINFDNFLFYIENILETRGYSFYAVTKAVNKIGEGSFSNGRTDIWQMALDGFLENPLGHWVSSFEVQYNLHQHNFILQMMWEFGLLGLIMAISILIKSSNQLFKQKNPKEKQLFMTTIFCSSIVFLLYSGTFWMIPCFWIWLLILDNRIQYSYE